RVRAILCTDIPSSTSQPSKPHDSGAALSAQVSGSAPKTGFLGKRLEVEAVGASAKHSWKIIQENIDRIENVNRRGESSGRKRGATVARLDTISEDVSDSTVSSDAPTVGVAISSSSIPPRANTNTGAIRPPAGSDEPSNSGADSSAQLDSVAEDVEPDSTISSNTAPIATSSSSSIPTPATGDTVAEAPTNADDHPLREARAAENAVEKNENKPEPKRVVTFSDEVQVRDLPMSKWDWEARRKFHSEAKEREIEDEYHVWAKGKPAMKRKRGEESFYGASSTSRDGARPLSEDEWNRLEKYQGVRSNPKEVVRSHPETAAIDVGVDVVFQFTFTLPPETPLIGARDHPSHNNPIGNTPPLALNPWTGLYYYMLCIPPRI
ncbi:hypothetical protein FRC04_007926, partial [Tulasnella sp. 424]